MNILITGASGLVGSSLLPFLQEKGHSVRPLVRGSRSPGGSEAIWDPSSGRLDRATMEGIDGVVHLAGESIAAGRWTAARKRRIRDSRVDGTRFLSEALAALSTPPKVLVTASAIGYYGDRGSETLREDSPPGNDYLASVCKDWEEATRTAIRAGIRVVSLRIGVVLSAAGGALSRMLPPFRLGLGGPLGGGRQFMSWIAIDDVAGVIHHAMITDSLSGPVNTVAPRAVTNREFTKILGRVLNRPTFVPVPAPLLRILLGEMADALLLSSTRAEPAKLEASGYQFRWPELEGALRHVLFRSA